MPEAQTRASKRVGSLRDKCRGTSNLFSYACLARLEESTVCYQGLVLFSELNFVLQAIIEERLGKQLGKGTGSDDKEPWKPCKTQCFGSNIVRMLLTQFVTRLHIDSSLA